MLETEILSRLRASPPRRVLAAAMLSSLSSLFLWIGLAEPLDWPWRLAMAGAGATIGYTCWRMWRDTGTPLVLRRDGIFTEAGEAIAPLELVIRVERGVFAIKPSNGFTVTLRASPGAAWRPGLWWRLGRRVGVGGVTGSGEARAMAEGLALLLAERGDQRH